MKLQRQGRTNYSTKTFMYDPDFSRKACVWVFRDDDGTLKAETIVGVLARQGTYTLEPERP